MRRYSIFYYSNLLCTFDTIPAANSYFYFKTQLHISINLYQNEKIIFSLTRKRMRESAQERSHRKKIEGEKWKTKKASKEDRTPDLSLTKRVLYRLSY